MNDPATDPFVIAVGASDTNGTPNPDDDFIADFSSRGELGRRPTWSHRAVRSSSLRAPGSLIDQAFPGGRVGDRLFRGSGTSQAAAVTSGAVALLLQQYPNLTPDQVKAALVASGLKLRTRKGEVLETGMKGIDIHKAADKARDVIAGKIPSAQNFAPATGLGTLEGARGSEHITDGNGVVLRGEVDVTGAVWDGSRWRDAAWNGQAWTDNGWDGSRWRDSSWNGSRWRSDGWTGSRWRSTGWEGSRWRGNGWLAAEFVPTDPLT